MRVNNPPGTIPSTIQIGGTTSPQTITTNAFTTVGATGFCDIIPVANQIEAWVSNNDAATTLNWRDTAATTSGVGVPIYPKSVAIITLNATIRLTNASASSVSIGVNQIAR